MKSFKDYLSETIRTYGAVGHSPAMGNTMEEKDVAEGTETQSEYDDRMRRLAAAYNNMPEERKEKMRRVPGWSDQMALAMDYVKKHPNNDQKSVAEGAMKDIDIEYQDYKRMSPQQFKAAYKISKSDWLAKHHDIVKESIAYVMDEMRDRAGLSNKEIE